jgi:hypothetical protein
LGFYHPKTQRKKKKKNAGETQPWVSVACNGSQCRGLLSFSQAISLSLLNDKKKEKEEWEERLSAGRRSGREEKIEGRRRNKKTI